MTKLTGTIAAFLMQIVLARILGANNFGDYIYVITWINFLTLFGKLGFEVASIKFVAIYKSNGQWGLLRGFMKRTFQIVLILSSLSAVLLLAGIYFLSLDDTLTPNLVQLFMIAAPLLVLLSLVQTQSGVLRGLGAVIKALAPQSILYPLIIIIFICLINFYNGLQVTTLAAILVTIVACSLIAFLQYFYIFNLRPEQLNNIKQQFSIHEWLGTSLAMAVTSGGQVLLKQLDIIIIGIMLGTKQAGIYAVATRFANLTKFGLQAVNTASAPIFAKIYSQKKSGDLQKAVSDAAKLNFLISFPLVTLLLVFAGSFLQFFGHEFSAGTIIIQILLLGEFVNIISGSNGLILNMSGFQNQLAKIIFGVVITYFILLVVFIQLWQMEGAAIATVSVQVLRNVIGTSMVWSYIGINPTLFSRYLWISNKGLN